MLSLVVNLVLFSIAGAISTVPVSITMMILLSPDPRRGAVPFLTGSMAGSIVIVGLSAVGMHYLPARPELDQDAFLTWLGLIVGAFLVGYAGYLFWHRSQTDNALLGKMKSKFRTARPWEFVVLGVGLNLRPKAIVLAVTAGALISVRDLPLLEGTLFVVAFAAVTQSAVVVPIAVWMHSPGRAEAPLTAIYTLLERHGRTITAAATLIIGLFILGSTIAGL
ncbi:MULTISPECIES: GAP family protein [unclassified Arthrobacter]|uniref:GAP family protein n=1 Tax=unclassified Arthrobacter TaxID=235627 RepID=UPI002E0403F3|nr:MULTISPECIES: GAP family protein [unclassified Arthrobacter]MEC5190854.1 cadmium resistance protein CadD (predicted permease) [Arthrobacter sp. MP_M4]MEC5202128.1 cadmium resistance protein CadD (predicted permease) [Arthrobacter sp. MP_M7]